MYTVYIFLVDNVPLHLYQEMRKSYLALAEILRHFWSCFPIKTPQLEEKVNLFFAYDLL